MIAQALLHLHPTADPLEDYLLRDDGNGPYIARWNTAKLGAKPTDEQITAASAAYNAAQTTNQQEQDTKRQARDTLRGKLATLGSGTGALTNTQRDTAIRDIARMIAEHLAE